MLIQQKSVACLLEPQLINNGLTLVVRYSFDTRALNKVVIQYLEYAYHVEGFKIYD
jgi:hypothetical protein